MIVEFKEHGIVISSDFDSGNLGEIEEFKCEVNTSGRKIFFKIIPLALKLFERSYFHFSIDGLKKGDVLCLHLETNLWRMYRFGMKPIFRYGENGKMKMIRLDPVTELPKLTEFGLQYFELGYKPSEENMGKKLYLSSFYPFPYSLINSEIDRIQKHIENTKALCETVYFHRDILTKSREGRNVEILTVTSNYGITDSYEDVSKYLVLGENESNILFPVKEAKRCHLFETTDSEKSKKIVFLTSRAHPSEVASSYGLFGFLDFLVQPTDPRSKLLRDNFIFKCVMCLNPDGVANGVYRYDTHKPNEQHYDLNRSYITPDFKKHPTIWSIRKYLEVYNENFGGCDLFVDMHGDPFIRDAFFYGNILPPPDPTIMSQSDSNELNENAGSVDGFDLDEIKLRNFLFPKMMEYNCQFFKCRSTQFCNSLKENKGTSRAVFGEYLYYDFLKNLNREKQKRKFPAFCFTLETNCYSSSEPLNPRLAIPNRTSEFDGDIIFEYLKGPDSCLTNSQRNYMDAECSSPMTGDFGTSYYGSLSGWVNKKVLKYHNNILANFHQKSEELFMGSGINAGPRFDIGIYRTVGKSLGLTILDFFLLDKNKFSFIRSKLMGNEEIMIDSDESIFRYLCKNIEEGFKK